MKPETSTKRFVEAILRCAVGGQVQLRSVGITDGRPRKVNFVTDMFGQVIWRGEKDNVTTAGDPHEMWFRFSGRQIGYVGNNGTQDVDYATSVAYRVATQGTNAFFNGQHSAPLHADWDLAYDSTNTYTQGSTRGMYVVQAGDTLSSIAAALWGDASLWWKLAEVNGLTAESTLPDGLPIIIPAGVIVHHNNALTYQPYDPLEVLGNTSPTSPKPSPKGKACGGGQVMLVLIAVLVTIYTAGGAAGGISSMLNGGTFASGYAAGMSAGSLTTAAAAGAKVGAMASGASVVGGSIATGAIAGGALTGAAVSMTSQALAVASGVQEKFSWNAVALAAIGGGVGGGLGYLGRAGGAATKAVLSNSFANGAIANVLTQGIGMAVGAQKTFSWAGVASSALGASIGKHIANPLLKNGAALLADAGARTLIEGSDFGDNMLAALPNVIGQTIGNAIAGGIAGRGDPRAMTSGAGKSYNGSKQLTLNGPAPCDVGSQDRSFWQRVGDFFSDVGDTLGFDGRLGFNNTRENRQAYLDSLRWPVGDEEEIVVTAPWQGGRGALEGYVPYSLRPESERQYASAAPPPPPSFGRQLYQTFVGNVVDRYNVRQQQGFALFDAADANGRQNAQLAPGFDIAFNNLETAGLVAGGVINYVGSPILAPIDAYVGRPLHMLSGGRIGVEFAGDATVTIGSMFVAPGAGAGRSMAVRGAVADGEAVVFNNGWRTADGRFAGALGSETPAYASAVDDLAAALQASGRDVSLNVYKPTLFGPRFVDIEVSAGGRVLGGIEVKTGGSPYLPAQQAKDNWLWLMEGYRTNVVRY